CTMLAPASRALAASAAISAGENGTLRLTSREAYSLTRASMMSFLRAMAAIFPANRRLMRDQDTRPNPLPSRRAGRAAWRREDRIDRLRVAGGTQAADRVAVAQPARDRSKRRQVLLSRMGRHEQEEDKIDGLPVDCSEI